MPEFGVFRNLRRPPRVPERRSALADVSILADFDRALDRAIDEAFALAERDGLAVGRGDLPLYQVLRYHLGTLDDAFRPASLDPGKRLRPRLCLLACVAAGGDPADALPVAAAIELLHNFTLVHDDVQDRSLLRRHRPSVWARWGEAQAINAGDAMFALAHIALSQVTKRDIPAEVAIELSTQLHLTTLRIVEGQVSDLCFEERNAVTADEYLAMISGKSAAICRYACWSGARAAGWPDERAAAFGEFGHSLGVGFQLRDDVLGVWGTTARTGKPAADDIRRRKKSLPVLLLRERVEADDAAMLDAFYRQAALADDDVAQVLELMTVYDVEREAQARVEQWHTRARSLLDEVVESGPARDELVALVNSLARRSG